MRISSRLAVARQAGAISARALALTAGAVLVVLAAIFFLYPRPAPEPTPAPEPVAPPATAEERGDTARDVIAELQAAGEVDYGLAYARAQEFHSAGRLADAQLLYFFAARGGYAPAAANLATMYDPNRFSSEASLMDEPDPFQAYKWYKRALEAGDETANDRLAELRAWAEDGARAGDPDAERLLLQWE